MSGVTGYEFARRCAVSNKVIQGTEETYLELHKFDVILLFKAFINLDLFFRQNLFPELVIA